MKSFASLRLGSLGTISVQHSISTDSDRPPGIAADAWVRLEENLGLVISQPPGGGSTSASAPANASGYLMIKHNGFWVRLKLE